MTSPAAPEAVDPYGHTLAAMRDAADPPTVAELATAMHRVGRNDAPTLLSDLVIAGVGPGVTGAVLRSVLPVAWSGAEWPCDCLSVDEWRDLFGEVGYTVDGEPVTRPAEPVQLYRGADTEHARGMSWSPRREAAQWFARRPVWPGPGTVWTTLAPPSALLARIDTQARPGEIEVVVDPVLLGPVVADPGM